MRPPTRAYHLRRAACLARAGDKRRPNEERRVADQLQPTTAFDHFLIGQEAYKRQDFDRRRSGISTGPFNSNPINSGPTALSALCWLQLKGPIAGQAGLNTCLEREPEFAWLYILRGFAIEPASPTSLPSGGRARRSRTPEADYGRAGSSWIEKPNDELRYILLVNRGLLRFQHAMLDAGGDGSPGGDPAQRPFISGVCRAGGGLPEAGQARRRRRPVRPGHRSADRTRRPCTAVEPT